MFQLQTVVIPGRKNRTHEKELGKNLGSKLYLAVVQSDGHYFFRSRRFSLHKTLQSQPFSEQPVLWRCNNPDSNQIWIQTQLFAVGLYPALTVTILFCK